MQTRFHRIRAAKLATFVLLALVAASTASAVTFTLAELQGGTSFMDTSGALTFDNFEVVVNGDLSSDLEDYSVVVREGGFDIVGPIAVADGNLGDIVIEYDVWAAEGNGITGASVWFNGAVSGNGSLAALTEDFLDEDGTLQIGELFVFVTGGGGSQKFDEVDFAEAFAHVHVIKDIVVDSGGIGGIAVLSVVQERFDTSLPPIAEPMTSSLLGLGLVGLWRFGRRRTAQV